MTRIIGIIVSILSMAIAFFSAYALANANEMAKMLSLGIKEFNAAEWQQHWQVTTMFYFISGCIGLLAGIGIFKNRKWGIFLFALLLSLLLLGHAILMVSGLAIFEFEKLNLIEAIVILFICSFSWYLYGQKVKEKNT